MAQAILGIPQSDKQLLLRLPIVNSLDFGSWLIQRFSVFQCWRFNMAKAIKVTAHVYGKKGIVGYSNGILTLAIGAIVLLLIFDGQTESDSALYHWGLYSFALSQTGW